MIIIWYFTLITYNTTNLKNIFLQYQQTLLLLFISLNFKIRKYI